MTQHLCQLASETMLHLKGAGIANFLQGQLTCDTRELSMFKAIPGALCTPKGRVLSDVVVIQLAEEHCILRLRRSIAQKVATSLARYAQFSRISVEAEQSDERIVGVIGDLDTPILGTSLIASTECYGIEHGDGILIVRRGRRIAELMSTKDETPLQLLFDLTAGNDIAVPSVRAENDSYEGFWQAELLRSGHFAINADDYERYTPQALNYDQIGLVSYKKGCYTGQEVIARQHYKRQSKRTLAVYQTNGESLLPGANLFAVAGAVTGAVTGKVAASPEGGNTSAVAVPAEANTCEVMGEPKVPQGVRVAKVLRVAPTIDGSPLVAAEVGRDHLGEVLENDSGIVLRPVELTTSSAE
ncbi:MAG: folate-binding protein [Pseudomonadota bacterium]